MTRASCQYLFLSANEHLLSANLMYLWKGRGKSKDWSGRKACTKGVLSRGFYFSLNVFLHFHSEMNIALGQIAIKSAYER